MNPEDKDTPTAFLGAGDSINLMVTPVFLRELASEIENRRSTLKIGDSLEVYSVPLSASGQVVRFLVDAEYAQKKPEEPGYLISAEQCRSIHITSRLTEINSHIPNVQDCISKACDEGKTYCYYRYTEPFQPRNTSINEVLLRLLQDKGYTVEYREDFVSDRRDLKTQFLISWL